MLLAADEAEAGDLIVVVDVGCTPQSPTCARADHLIKTATGESAREPHLKLATFFAASAFRRIDHLFADIRSNNDRKSYSLSRKLLGFDND